MLKKSIPKIEHVWNPYSQDWGAVKSLAYGRYAYGLADAQGTLHGIIVCFFKRIVAR
jgi:hypothetical protein